MRSFFFLVLGTLAFTTAAYAQAATRPPSKGYIEAVAQSAFGNITSQSYGVEGGGTVMGHVQVFGEFGKVSNTAPATLGTAAQQILTFLGSGFTMTAKQPVTFGAGGVRFVVPSQSKLEPYLLAGFGAAQVKKDVAFSQGGSDITANLTQFGVVLGTDLSGTETKPMLVLGGGIAWPIGAHFVLDFQFRFGRVFLPDEGLNIGRAGAGIGVRF